MAACATLETLAETLFPPRHEFLSVKDAARQTSVSERTIRRRISSGELQSKKLGSRRLIDRSSLERLLTD